MSDRFIGLDVSKGYVDVAILDDTGAPAMKQFQLDDTAKGHAKLFAIIEDQYRKDSSLSFYAAVESTGGLENNWLYQLRTWKEKLPVHSARLNPNGVAQHIKADLTRTITDEVSARAIAEYQIAHQKKIRYDETERSIELLRPTWTAYVLLKKQQQQICGNLHPLLYTANPGIITYCKRGIPSWLRSVLEQYPTAKKLAKARVSTLAKIPYITTEKAEKLILTASRECGSRTDDAAEQTIRLLIEQLKHTESMIAKLEKVMISSVAKDQDVSLVDSIKGIGTVSAIGLLMNMPEISRLADSGKLGAYWGLHPVFKQSGDGKTVSRMSKAGRVQPRAILFMVALSAIAHNEHIRTLYKRKVRSGMSKMAAIGFCMHKIARIVYGVLKTGKKYDANIDKKNSEKTPKIVPITASIRHRQSLRRMQEEDPAAPISKREIKRRAAMAEPQDTHGIEHEVISRKAACM